MAASILQHSSITSTANSSSVVITVSATAAGSLVIIGTANQGTDTVSTVTDNAAGGSNTWVQAAGAAATANTIDGIDIWYVFIAAKSFTQITVTFTGSVGVFFKGIAFWEVSGFTNPVIDVIGTPVNNTLQTTQDDTGPAVVTTSTNGFIVSMIDSGTTGSISANPKAGNEFTSGGDTVSTTTPAVASSSLISSTAASHQCIVRDGNSFINYCATVVSFKEGPPLVVTNNNIISATIWK